MDSGLVYTCTNCAHIVYIYVHCTTCSVYVVMGTHIRESCASTTYSAATCSQVITEIIPNLPSLWFPSRFLNHGIISHACMCMHVHACMHGAGWVDCLILGNFWEFCVDINMYL